MRVAELEVSVYTIPTESPETDGTFRWDSTTLVLVEAVAEDGQRGLGFSYASAAVGTLIEEVLASVVVGCSVENVREAWQAMVRSVCNIGRPHPGRTGLADAGGGAGRRTCLFETDDR